MDMSDRSSGGNDLQKRKSKLSKKAAKGEITTVETFHECRTHSIIGISSIAFIPSNSRKDSKHDINLNDLRDLLLYTIGVKQQLNKSFTVKNRPFIRSIILVHISNVSHAEFQDVIPVCDNDTRVSLTLKLSSSGVQARRLPHRLLTVSIDELNQLQAVVTNYNKSSSPTITEEKSAGDVNVITSSQPLRHPLHAYIMSEALMRTWGYPVPVSIPKSSSSSLSSSISSDPSHDDIASIHVPSVASAPISSTSSVYQSDRNNERIDISHAQQPLSKKSRNHDNNDIKSNHGETLIGVRFGSSLIPSLAETDLIASTLPTVKVQISSVDISHSYWSTSTTILNGGSSNNNHTTFDSYHSLLWPQANDSSSNTLSQMQAPQQPFSQQQQVLALDCEMCATASGLCVTRVSLIDSHCNTLLDTLVKPEETITDYLTHYSGITAEMLENVNITLNQVRIAVLRIISGFYGISSYNNTSNNQSICNSIYKNNIRNNAHNNNSTTPTTTPATTAATTTPTITTETILVGHSLENDLKALRICHAHCVDTAVLYPHPRGYPYRQKLKFVAEKYLQIKIQQQQPRQSSALLSTTVKSTIVFNENTLKTAETTTETSSYNSSSVGHDSVEDAKTTLKLALLKAEKGSSFGLPHNNNNNINTEDWNRCSLLGNFSSIADRGNSVIDRKHSIFVYTSREESNAMKSCQGSCSDRRSSNSSNNITKVNYNSCIVSDNKSLVMSTTEISLNGAKDEDIAGRGCLQGVLYAENRIEAVERVIQCCQDYDSYHQLQYQQSLQRRHQFQLQQNSVVGKDESTNSNDNNNMSNDNASCNSNNSVIYNDNGILFCYLGLHANLTPTATNIPTSSSSSSSSSSDSINSIKSTLTQLRHHLQSRSFGHSTMLIITSQSNIHSLNQLSTMKRACSNIKASSSWNSSKEELLKNTFNENNLCPVSIEIL